MGDTLALGFNRIFDAITSENYLGFDGFATVYSLAQALSDLNPTLANRISDSLDFYNIHGRGYWGEGESNDGGIAHSLPIYRNTTLGTMTELCSGATLQGANGLGARSFARIDLPRDGEYTFSIERDGGNAGGNPQAWLSSQGGLYWIAQSSARNSEHFSLLLRAGTYVVELFDDLLLSQGAPGSTACYQLTVTSR